VRLTTSHHKNQVVQKPDSLDIEKNVGRLFRGPKLTLSFSVEGKEGMKTEPLLSVETSDVW
jgi:hypothetical protein